MRDDAIYYSHAAAEQDFLANTISDLFCASRPVAVAPACLVEAVKKRKRLTAPIARPRDVPVAKGYTAAVGPMQNSYASAAAMDCFVFR